MKLVITQAVICGLFAILLLGCSPESGTDSAASTGTNGSYSAMIIVGDYLYQVGATNITTTDISDPEAPQTISDQSVGFRIETIYHQSGVLFVGSSTAMYIYTIGPDGIPLRESTTTYGDWDSGSGRPAIMWCDPIVSDGTYAYVTLATTVDDGPCGGFRLVNELRVYDVSDLTQPILLTTIEMGEPKGLTYDGDHLFVCDGPFGLKVFDRSDPSQPELIRSFDDVETFDAIAQDGLLIVVGPQQILQYDYSDIDDMALVGTIDL